MRITSQFGCVALFATLGASQALGADDTLGWRERLATPSPEFSQMPFWFWNDRIAETEIRRQLADWREHGVYGFVIHARMGLAKDVGYMSPRWLELVKFAVEEAARTNMRVCLYDEGMYPSGSAHGAVVRSNPAFAAQGLAAAHQDVDGPVSMACPKAGEGEHVATVVARLSEGERPKIDGGSIKLIEDTSRPLELGDGRWRIMTFARVPSEGRIRGVHEGEEDREPGAPAAADLLNPEAMQTFIRLAYEPYHEAVGQYFSKTVIGMFTDEPSMLGRGGRRGLKPWTTGFAEYFAKARGYSILPQLPALWWDIGERTGAIRADFELTVAERFDETYYQPLSDWCEKHGIALTGHPGGATEIYPLRHFQIPGQDIVWRGVLPDKNAVEGVNSALGKCSSSVARHDARRFNANEVYGAYGWQLTMDEMKWLADWLMVRGVNLLYPHAFYFSIRDYRVNERPPDLGPNNAWWPHYKLFADYTSRLCGLLTDKEQVCDVAVLCGNHDLPFRAAKWLYRNQVDFNYVEDWRLVEQAKVKDGRLVVGPMTYALLIVDQDAPPAGRLADCLQQWTAQGVRIHYCRGEPDAALVEALPRDLRVEPAAADLRYVHLTQGPVHYYLLVNEGEGVVRTTIDASCRGESAWFDAWTGQFSPALPIEAPAERRMRFRLELPRRESLVLCIDTSRPAPEKTEPNADRAPSSDEVAIDGPWIVANGEGKQFASGLGDWTAVPELAEYAGMLTYRTRFSVKREGGKRCILDAGRVGDWAVVRLNGQTLPVRLWAPFTWDVSDQLADGDNDLAIEVTNSLANRYDAKNRRPSGLMGPVRLIVTDHPGE